MRIRAPLRTLWKHRWILATAMCAGASMAIALAVRQPPVCLAEAQIFIAPGTSDAGGRGSSDEDVRTTEELASYAAHAESLSMAQTVIRRESLDIAASELAGKVEADVLPETRVVSVGVADSDASEAQSLATAFATAFAEEGVRQVGPGDARASVLEAAPLPEEPVSPKPMRDGFIGLGVGAMAGILLTFILRRPASKSSKTRTQESTLSQAAKTPPRVDLKPAVRSTSDLLLDDEELDERIEVPEMGDEEPAGLPQPRDPLAIYPATRTFLNEADRSLASPVKPESDEESISVRIRQAVRRGMTATASSEGGLTGKRPEAEGSTERRPSSIPAYQSPSEDQQTPSSSDAIGAQPDVEYEAFWQMGREHDDPAEKEKPRNAKSKEKPRNAKPKEKPRNAKPKENPPKA